MEILWRVLGRYLLPLFFLIRSIRSNIFVLFPYLASLIEIFKLETESDPIFQDMSFILCQSHPPRKIARNKFYKIPGFGRPNCQELWLWDLRTSCRFTVLCHSRALSPLSPCHCLVHLYDLQVSSSSRQMWLWFWHSKIQSEVCNCRNVWLMFKLINMIWYANLKLVIYCEWDVEVEFFVDNQTGFFVDNNFELLPFPFRNACPWRGHGVWANQGRIMELDFSTKKSDPFKLGKSSF